MREREREGTELAAGASMTVEIESQLRQHHLQLLQPQRRLPSSTCDLHPGEAVTGFCASCLRQRLAGLEGPVASAGRKSTSALRSVFCKVSSGAAPAVGTSFLRRSKSFSFFRGGGDGFSAQRAAAASFEPQRKSCDVRGRSTLWSLFHQDDHHMMAEDPCVPPSASASITAPAVAASNDVLAGNAECRNLGLLDPSVAPRFSETREERESDDEIRPIVPVVMMLGRSGEKNEHVKDAAAEERAELKPMKDHIDLDSQPQRQQTKKPAPKDLKEIASSFWLAASVFSKKLQKWRRRQKLKKQGGDVSMPAEKPPKTSRRFRDTQSEVAVDVSGRRSCDTDPRFSLDASRMSFDDSRFSWDEPRASWDGYLIGGRSLFPRLPPMLSLVEDAPTQAVPRSDYLIPVEEDVAVPGGSAQTRDYYMDSSSRRRRSLDLSNSIKKQPTETTGSKPVSNGKVSPAGGNGKDFLQIHNGTLFDRDVKYWSSNSLRDDYLGSFESAFRDPHRGAAAKSRRWCKTWNIWGFIQRRNSSREANTVERSFSESWPELRSSSFNSRVLRSNSSISSRNSFRSPAGYGGIRNSSMKSSGHCKKNKRDDYVLERNISARYSPNRVDNGLLKFYMTPMRNSRRHGVSAKGRQIASHYFTRSMLGLH